MLVAISVLALLFSMGVVNAYWKHSVYIYAYQNGSYKCAQNSADGLRDYNDYAGLGFSSRRFFVPTYFYE